MIRLLIDTTSADGRQEVRGISRYAREYGPWDLHLESRKLLLEQSLDDTGPTPDGVIARITYQSLADRCHRFGSVPIVNLAEVIPDLPWPIVATDADAIAEIAVDHLLTRGYRQVAFCGYNQLNFSQDRRRGVVKSLDRRGMSATIFDEKPAAWPRVDAHEQARLTDWLRSLPPATGVVCCNDWRGLDVLQACARERIDVPGRLGVVGIDDDEVVADAAHVALTSVDIGSFAAGYEAASLLDAWMRGRPPSEPIKRISQGRLNERDSTSALPIDDPIVHEALLAMRNAASMPASIEELVDGLPISRRPFEKRFRAATGRSPYEELLACRLREVERLLIETDLPIAEIAERTRYAYPHHLAVTFKRTHGCTPTRYRRDRQASRTARGLEHRG
ncbi:MAG: substrate-binding domain-containing protein [Planctomycetota bacterium]